MSEQSVFPAMGIRRLIIEEMARDAQLWGVADASEIHVTYQSVGEGDPVFTAEGEDARLEKILVQRISVPADLAVTIKRAMGDLHIRNLSAEINAEITHGDLRLGALGGITRIARVDGDLRADDVADLRLLGTCAGDLRFEAGGAVEAETVSGDVRIAGAGDIRLHRVHGDLWVEQVAGALQAERVNGDVRLNEITGLVTLRAIHGDFRGIALRGGLSAPQVQGDAALQGPFSGEAGYTLTTDGDVSLLLPADADLRLTARASGRIRSDASLIPTSDGSPTFTATLGQGRCRVNVTSSGDLRIAQIGVAGPKTTAEARGPATPEDLRSLGDRIRQQVAASLAAAGITLEGAPGGWLGRGPKPAKPPRAPQPPERPRPPTPPPLSSEEELRILRMVEAGTITAQQAEMLLKAFEG